MPQPVEHPSLRNLQPGRRIRVRQVIKRREGDWHRDIVGEVVRVDAQPTGSWYAHSKDDRYWLRRVRLRKDDGDITTLTLDQNTTIELLDAPPAGA